MASVTLEHLTKTYPNGFVSVNDVSLHIEDGEFVIFHGPSGCGKSTILRMIGGLEDITSGEIWLGKDLLNDILPRDRRLAMAFQNYTLYRHFNAYDNMALGLRLRDLPRTVIDSRVKEAAKFFGLTDVLDKKIKALSRGYQSIFKLTVALALRVPYLVFDEPVLGLDANHRELFYELLLKDYEEKQRTIVIATHLIEEVAGLIEEVVLMDEGRILLQEDTETLMERGYCVSGSAAEVEEYCRDKQVIGTDELGALKLAYVLGDRKEEEAGGNLRFSGMNLQKLFVKLTEKGGRAS